MMTVDLVTSASNVSASEMLSQTVEVILEIVTSANNVLVNKESFKELATYLERIVPVLKELNKKDVGQSESLNTVTEILNREIKAAKQLMMECCKRNKVYLLMNCRSIVKRLEGTTTEISRALGLLPLASLDISTSIREEVGELCDNMGRAEFKAALAEEEILEKVESGIQERNVDRSYANNLLSLIADAVGISTERSALKKEFDEFKSEIENARLRKDQAEAIQMEQIIALLERADAASSPMEKETKYFSKRKSLGSQPLEPLQSFYCPITREVMVDPVETSSGQTFERSAIEKWFSAGNKLCPLTMTLLDTSILRPNKTLRQSIEEWKDRNTIITIASMKSKLISEDAEEVLHCLEELQELCQNRDQHREWVILENYMPSLIHLLGFKNRDIRQHALVILRILVKASDDAKERLANVDEGLESIVKFLGRRIEERKLAVALLLELSKCDLLRDCIGKTQGCIFYLVTMLSCDDSQGSRDAEALLENLSVSDQNVVQMAKANYFKYLLQRLSSGTEDIKIIMATTLAEMELTDHHKESLLVEGVLGPLLHMMIKDGATHPLLDLLLRQSLSSSILREQAAATIMHLALSTMSQEASQTPVSLLESEQEVLTLFSLVNLTGPDVQLRILQTFNALCQSPSAKNIKSKLIQCSAIQVLVQLCEHDDQNVRPNAVKLFCCLVDDGDEAIILEHVGQKCLETLVKIIQTSDNEEEIASAMGIISNLPEVPQITQWLLDARALQTVLKILKNCGRSDPNGRDLVANAAGAVRRFTNPTNLEWQKRAAEADVIPTLVKLLGYGTTLAKEYAAMSLARFSENSIRLSRPIPKRKGLWCFSPPPDIVCNVHGGFCTVESSFCLLEAEAVGPLVRVLEEPDPGASEASLDALLTLIEAERLQSGSKVLEAENAIDPIIKFLSSPSPRLQEKALHALERIFRLPEYKQKYGQSAQMRLVDITQRGNSSMKSLSARILAHLNVLHDQSSYF
ncbi:hypothetical protein QYF36_011240 [Acer negundo]|nr:hypothetical protein QYF36_011240 [Acer negundo]